MNPQQRASGILTEELNSPTPTPNNTLTGLIVRAGDNEEGQPRLIIYTTAEQLKALTTSPAMKPCIVHVDVGAADVADRAQSTARSTCHNPQCQMTHDTLDAITALFHLPKEDIPSAAKALRVAEAIRDLQTANEQLKAERNRAEMKARNELLPKLEALRTELDAYRSLRTELDAYRSAGVTEALLRRNPEGCIKVGYGCEIALAGTTEELNALRASCPKN